MTAHRLSALVRMARVWGPIVKEFAANSGLTGLASNKTQPERALLRMIHTLREWVFSTSS